MGSGPRLGMNWVALARKHTGSGNTGELVARMAAYQLCKNPREWVSFSREEWSIELAMSLQEFDRALARAVATKLITRHEKRAWRGPKLVARLQLTSRARTVLNQQEEGLALSLEGDTGLITSDDTHIEEEKEEIEDDSFGIMNPPNPHSQGLGKMATVKEILASGSKQKKLEPKGDMSPNQLADIWKFTLSELYPKTWIGNLTQKQKGQLKLIIKAAPNGESGLILNYVLRNWFDYVMAVKDATTFKEVPDKPNIGFLLATVNVAVNFYRDSVKPLHTSSKVLVKAKTVYATAPEQKDDIASLDDILG